MAHRSTHPRHLRAVTSYVDGGVALVADPYDAASWRRVREGWWWHVLAMVAFPPYAVVALVVWQRPSGQPLARRVVWALLATLGALVLVGLGAFVRFSRRWYWWHRERADVDAVAGAPVGGGPLAHRTAEAGSHLADRVAGTGHRRLRHGVALPWLASPWGPLRDQVAEAAVRVARVVAHAHGPVAEAVARATHEVHAAFATASAAAERAARADEALDRFGAGQLADDLGALATSPGDPGDLEAARRALEAQTATAQRVAQTLARTEGQLRRLAAQAGEVAARTEELVWAPALADGLDGRGLVAVTDQLAALRGALDELDALELPLATA